MPTPQRVPCSKRTVTACLGADAKRLATLSLVARWVWELGLQGKWTDLGTHAFACYQRLAKIQTTEAQLSHQRLRPE